jgi:hypothetical protein
LQKVLFKILEGSFALKLQYFFQFYFLCFSMNNDYNNYLNMNPNMSPNQQNGFNYYTPGVSSNQSPYANFFQQQSHMGFGQQAGGGVANNLSGFPTTFFQANQGRMGLGVNGHAASFAAPQMPGYGAAMPPTASAPNSFPANAYPNENPNVLKRSKKDFFEGTLSVKDSNPTSGPASKNSIMQSIAPKVGSSQRNAPAASSTNENNENNIINNNRNPSTPNNENTPLLKTSHTKLPRSENISHQKSKNQDFINLISQIRNIINTV